MNDNKKEQNIKSEIEGTLPSFVTSDMKLKRDVKEKAVSIFLLMVGIYLGCLIFIILPTNPELGASYKAFVMSLFAGFFVWLLRKLAALWVKEGTVLFKSGVESRISAADLRKRWGREVSHDFLNVVFETRLNVYLRSEKNPKRALIVKGFYSQFMPDKDQVSILFNEGCFFDLNEILRVEEAYSRLSQVDYASSPKIEELEKELEDARTLKARLSKSEKKLEGARKEGFFFANMVLEMVTDPTAKKQFPHKEYKAIADKVIAKDYIQNLEMVRPANSVIEEFRDNLPAEFRHEGNKPK